MPACSPRCTSDSANGSAHAKITTAGEHEQRADDDASLSTARELPISRAGPTRCGSSDGERAMRTTNTTKMPMRTTASTSVSVRFSGSVSE